MTPDCDTCPVDPKVVLERIPESGLGEGRRGVWTTQASQGNPGASSGLSPIASREDFPLVLEVPD